MSTTKNQFVERMKSESGENGMIRRLCNDTLDCKNCKHRYDDSVKLGNTSVCEVFKTGKPNKVLLGKKCDVKEKED